MPRSFFPTTTAHIRLYEEELRGERLQYISEGSDTADIDKQLEPVECPNCKGGGGHFLDPCEFCEGKGVVIRYLLTWYQAWVYTMSNTLRQTA